MVGEYSPSAGFEKKTLNPLCYANPLTDSVSNQTLYKFLERIHFNTEGKGEDAGN